MQLDLAFSDLTCSNSVDKLDGLDFEVETDQRKYKTTKILHQKIENFQSFSVFAFLNINQRPDLGSLKVEKGSEGRQIHE